MAVADLRRATQPSERLSAPIDDPPLHIVLVEPQIPPNTGNVARLCAATGCVLHLVEPLGFSIDDRALKRAGLDYWDALGVRVHQTLERFMSAWSAPFWLVSTRGTQRYDLAPYRRGDAVIFGKETAGLPGALLKAHHERTLRIPMRPGSVRSLNLSTAVGIVAYRALERLGFDGLS